VYTIHDYGHMTGERRRTDAYVRALGAAVTPGSAVLDIGAGAGFLTLLACQAGARKVYAIESEGIIEVARETVVASGYGDRVEFIQGISTAVSLPEKVDVVVSDIHGVLPLFSGSVASILDARDRLMLPRGVLIPAGETVWVAVASAAGFYDSVVGPWENAGRGLDLSPARRRAVNTWCGWRADPTSLLVEPRVWLTLDYGTLTDLHARGTARWTISRAGTAHGLCMWFDCETAPGAGFSNAPGSGMGLYHQGFFPWPEAVNLEPGDAVAVEVRADPVGNDYIWSWNTEIQVTRTGAPGKASFRQSGFLADPISTDWLRKTGASFVPSLNPEAHVDKFILDRMMAGVSLGVIAREVVERFHGQFPDWRRALSRVGEMSLRYSA
jgi:protein arginine N-methyltransferase 1